MPAFELLSYFLLLVVAGNETTRNAASGGLLALIENPDERRKLRVDPGLVPTAVEEIVRWTSPVIQFCRTPVESSASREAHPSRRFALPALSVGEPRRRRLPRARPLPRRPPPEPAPRLRHRRALLPRRESRPPRAARDLLRAGDAPREHRACRARGAHALELPRRCEAHADPVSAATHLRPVRSDNSNHA